MRQGQILRAREQLLTALGAAPPEVLLELGRSFDPYYLAIPASVDGKPEPTRARTLYEEAIRHGSKTAAQDLERLNRTTNGAAGR